jgi:uncharacterized protein (TIGR01244 family)
VQKISHWRGGIGVALAAVLVLGAGAASAASLPPRPATWASPLEDAGLSNCYRIEPDFYRSAQPTADGFRKLASLGVKTVLDVAGGAGDAQVAEGTSLKLVHVPMTAFGLRDDRVLEALRVLADPANRPVVIHCRQGADRTGAIVALYRVVVQGWTKEEAIREMNGGGYHHSFLFGNLDRYVRTADVGALRKALGITPASLLEAKSGTPTPSSPVKADVGTTTAASATAAASN